MKLIIKTLLGFTVIKAISAFDFISEQEAKLRLISRQKRNNEEWEGPRSSIERECVKEDCSFEEFTEAAENLPDVYGAVTDQTKGELMTAFDNLYTQNPSCNVTNDK